jgi:hypothetical protein
MNSICEYCSAALSETLENSFKIDFKTYEKLHKKEQHQSAFSPKKRMGFRSYRKQKSQFNRCSLLQMGGVIKSLTY